MELFQITQNGNFDPDSPIALTSEEVKPNTGISVYMIHGHRVIGGPSIPNSSQKTEILINFT